MRIAVVNAAYDPALGSPEALLDRYSTLTGWCGAVAAAGAAVQVVQRFSASARLDREGVRYLFLDDGGRPGPSVWWAGREVIDAALSGRPDLVHINGMGFPRLVSGIKALSRGTMVIVQDHGGPAPSRDEGFGRRLISRPGLGRTDACMFTAIEQARPWRDAGLARRARVIDVVESSTAMRATARAEARARSGVTGDPAMLCVGRLSAGKDPMTVLDGFDRARADLPAARLYLVYHEAPLEAAVRSRIERSPALTGVVTMVGEVPRERMTDYYSAADLFISGSHAEGSGYALIEALACGATPVVTDIPPFRAIAGDTGGRFPVGDAAACATEITRLAHADRPALRAAARARFDTALTWEAIGRRAVTHYRELLGTM